MTDALSGFQCDLTPFEAEHFIRELRMFKLEEYAGAEWLTQHERIEKLNLTAHQQAKDGVDEFIVDYLQTEDKLDVLIYDLVLAETWKEQIYPLVKDHTATMSSLRSYLPLYHEASTANLLECALFHRASCDVAGDALVDLVDWCYRKLTYLVATPNPELFPPALESAQQAMSWTPVEQLDHQLLEVDFQVACCALSILRFLTDHRKELPLTLTTRLLENLDVLLLLVPLMEKAPWVRRNRRNEEVIEVFDDHQWRALGEEDAGKLPKLHTQLWMCIYNLVMDGECRARYEMTSVRKSTLLRLRRYLNEVVFDQLPPLTELLRSLEELSISGSLTHDPQAPAASPFVVELVAEFRATLMHTYEGRWAEIATLQLQGVLTKETKDELRRLADMVVLPPELLDPKCAMCGQDADLRCTKCKNEFYCTRECQVSHWKQHKATCKLLAEIEAEREAERGAAELD